MTTYPPTSRLVTEAALAAALENVGGGGTSLLEGIQVHLRGHSQFAAFGMFRTDLTVAGRLSRRTGVTVKNGARSGSGLNFLFDDLMPGGGLPWVFPSQGVVGIDCVINDARTIARNTGLGQFAPIPADAVKGWGEALRDCIRVVRAKALYTYGHPSITLTGFTSEFSGYRFTTNPDDRAVIATTATDIALLMGSTYESDTTARQFEYQVNDGPWTYVGARTHVFAQYIHATIPITGMPAGTNTVRVRYPPGKTNGAAFFRGYLDMTNPAPPGVVLLPDAAADAVGMAVNGSDTIPLTAPQLAAQLANLDALNAKVFEVAAIRDDPTLGQAGDVVVGDPREGWTTLAATQKADSIHANPFGHFLMANAIERATGKLRPSVGIYPDN